jgi:hypothetical protein
MWNNINNLTSIASYIQWTAIAFAIMVAILQGGKVFIERRINNLKEKELQIIETARIETERNLNYQIDTLGSNLSNSIDEIEELKKKTAYVDPYTQPIQIGIATVYIIVQSNEQLNANYMDAGGYLAFKQGNNEMLMLSNDESEVRTILPGKLSFKVVFNLDINHPNIGKKLTFLKDAEYLQIYFDPVNKDYNVIEGKAICTFNGNARIEFNIPKQTMQNKLVFVRNISSTLNEVLK